MIRKKIHGFSNYEISKCGRVFSIRRKHNQSDKYDEKEIELKIQYIDNAYAILGLVDDDGRHRMKSIHRLVAEAFIENPEKKRTVNHKDGDKHNNVASNLEWATYQENSKHACDTGLNPKQSGEKNSQYGTCWIYKEKENLKIRKDSLEKFLKKGWKKGRILK